MEMLIRFSPLSNRENHHVLGWCFRRWDFKFAHLVEIALIIGNYARTFTRVRF